MRKDAQTKVSELEASNGKAKEKREMREWMRGRRTWAGKRTGAPPLRIAVPADDPAPCLAPGKRGAAVSSRNSLRHHMSLLSSCVFVITGLIEDPPKPLTKDLEFPSAENCFFFFFLRWVVGHRLHLRLGYFT